MSGPAPVDLSDASDDFYRKMEATFRKRLEEEPNAIVWHFMAEIVRENLRLRRLIRGGSSAICGAQDVDANGAPCI